MSGAAAFAAGALGALGLAELLRSVVPRRLAVPGFVSAVSEALRDGREPGGAERTRVLAAGAAVLFGAGLLLGGPPVAFVLGAAGPWLAARALGIRGERRRRALERDAPALAVSLADALSGGHSVRSAVARAAPALPGAAGDELRRAAAELRLGASTDAALGALATRSRSHAIEVIVAACVLQGRAGGDLAATLRRAADSFSDAARLAADARAQTAQARLTAGLVASLPLGAAALAELASPGFARALAGNPLSLAMVVAATALQGAAWVAIRRFARVSE